MSVNVSCDTGRMQLLDSTYLCIVTPMVRRSDTRRTLLTTSRPKSSKTRTFHIGLPSASRMGATGASSACAWASSLSVDCTVSLRFKIFLRDAGQRVVLVVRSMSGYQAGLHEPIWRSRSVSPRIAMAAVEDAEGGVGRRGGSSDKSDAAAVGVDRRVSGYQEEGYAVYRPVPSISLRRRR